MNIYHTIDDFRQLPHAVVTSGMFDGVHLGHQKIISRLTSVSKQCGGESVVLTFWPHPRLVVSEDSQDLKLLTTIDEKIGLLSQLGVEHLLIVPFTRAFSELTSDEFIRNVLVDRIGTRKLVIGYDHRFGRNREGSFSFLQENAHLYGFEVEEIARRDIDETTISSSRIRTDLMEGKVREANHLLGYAYRFSGTVVKGKQLGRTIGFPTANIQVNEGYKLIPSNGVYAIRAFYNGQMFQGMLNIGVRPTVDGTQRTIEANLFDFTKEIYGEWLTVEVVDYLRPEEKFDGLEALVRQLHKDREQVQQHFSRHP